MSEPALRVLDIMKEDQVSTVMKCWYENGGQIVVSKKIPLSERARIERDILADLDHHAIPKLLDSYVQGNMLYLVMECKLGETLSELMKRKAFKEVEVVRIIKQLADIIYYLHVVKKLVHRDIKPDNIIVDDSGHVSLIDFGFADYASENMHERLGSPAYCSPELVVGKPHTISTDIWSLGIVTYHLIRGKLPFNGKTIEEVFKSIYYDTLPMQNLHRSSPECRAFLMEVLDKDPKHRLNISQVVQHPWLKMNGIIAGKGNLLISQSLKTGNKKQTSLPIIRPTINHSRTTLFLYQ